MFRVALCHGYRDLAGLALVTAFRFEDGPVGLSHRGLRSRRKSQPGVTMAAAGNYVLWAWIFYSSKFSNSIDIDLVGKAPYYCLSMGFGNIYFLRADADQLSLGMDILSAPIYVYSVQAVLIVYSPLQKHIRGC